MDWAITILHSIALRPETRSLQKRLKMKGDDNPPCLVPLQILILLAMLLFHLTITVKSVYHDKKYLHQSSPILSHNLSKMTSWGIASNAPSASREQQNTVFINTVIHEVIDCGCGHSCPLPLTKPRVSGTSMIIVCTSHICTSCWKISRPSLIHVLKKQVFEG